MLDSYSKDAPIEQPAIALFGEVGWQTPKLKRLWLLVLVWLELSLVLTMVALLTMLRMVRMAQDDDDGVGGDSSGATMVDERWRRVAVAGGSRHGLRFHPNGPFQQMVKRVVCS